MITMGTCWEIVDEKNKRLFDLDKGYWVEARLDVGGPRTLDAVRDGIGRAFAHRPGGSMGSADYIEATAKAIWEFCEEAEWQIVVVSDAGDYPDDEMLTWPTTAGRMS